MRGYYTLYAATSDYTLIDAPQIFEITGVGWTQSPAKLIMIDAPKIFHANPERPLMAITDTKPADAKSSTDNRRADARSSQPPQQAAKSAADMPGPGARREADARPEAEDLAHEKSTDAPMKPQRLSDKELERMAELKAMAPPPPRVRSDEEQEEFEELQRKQRDMVRKNWEAEDARQQELSRKPHLTNQELGELASLTKAREERAYRGDMPDVETSKTP